MHVYKNEKRWKAMEFNGIGIGESDFKALRIRNNYFGLKIMKQGECICDRRWGEKWKY